jgi:hypothetical protein
MKKDGSMIAKRIVRDMEREKKFREKYKEYQIRQKNMKQNEGEKCQLEK